MRIVSYNILDGGEGRADPLAEVIIAQRPDIVALIEADNLAVVERIAARLKMDFIYAEGNSHAVALLSRFIIRDSINHAPLRPELTKCFLEATMALPSGDELPVGVLHLHHYARLADEQKRLSEIGTVLELLARHRETGRPHLLMGDFNSNSPRQKIDPAKLKPSSQEQYAANGNMLPRDVITLVEQAGYVDTLQVAHPMGAAKAGSFSTQHPGQRVDYVFAHGFKRRQIRDAWVERDRLAKYASDHFPVGAEIL